MSEEEIYDSEDGDEEFIDTGMDDGDEVITLCPLPEGAIPIAAVEICEYITEDGDRSYVVRYNTNITYSTIIGLLEMGKFHILGETGTWADVETNDND